MSDHYNGAMGTIKQQAQDLPSPADVQHRLARRQSSSLVVPIGLGQMPHAAVDHQRAGEDIDQEIG